MKRLAIVAAVIIVLVGAAVGFVKTHPAWTMMHVAPVVMDIQHPIGPPRAITWQQGPASAERPPDQRPPNVVFILADDLGWNGIKLNGGIAHGAVPTPHIDSIASSGVRFTNGYAPNATCAPSRAALMTGRYATRFGYEFTPTPDAMVPAVNQLIQQDPHFIRKPIVLLPPGTFAPPFDSLGMPTSQITIAQEMKKAGYHTVEIGKWHLGEYGKYEPTHRGFDESLQLAGLLHQDKDAADVVNAPPAAFDGIDRFLWAVGGAAVRFNGDKNRFDPKEYLTDYFTDQAVKVIHANRNRPFFLYLAYWAVHGPLQSTRQDYDALPQIKDHTERVYGGMIRGLDRNVGRVLQALKDNGLLQNTLVIFTSDNGAPGYEGMADLNQPYRGWKMTYFQGGIRVPFYMQWPGHIAPGSTYAKPVQGVDIFATAAAAAGAPMPTDRKMDGVNLIPYVSGANPGSPHKTLYWRDGGYRVLLEDGWKLQVMQVAKVPEKIWLFDLNTDPTEQHNVASQHPDRVASMTKTLIGIDKQQAPSLWKPAIAVPVEIDKDAGQKQSADDPYVYWTN